jgi:hypothetical protein
LEPGSAFIAEVVQAGIEVAIDIREPDATLLRTINEYEGTTGSEPIDRT